MTSIASAANTASKLELNFASRSRIRKRNVGKAAAEQLGADPVNRCMVNMGTVV
jgi:hypothetical protein